MELLSPQRGSFTVQGLQFFFLFLLPLSDPFSLPLSGSVYDVEDGEMHLYRRHFKLPPKCGSNPFLKKNGFHRICDSPDLKGTARSKSTQGENLRVLARSLL